MNSGRKVRAIPGSPNFLNELYMRELKPVCTAQGIEVYPSISKNEACEFLNISKSTIERLEKSGELLPIRTNSAVNYDFGDVLAYRNANKGRKVA